MDLNRRGMRAQQLSLAIRDFWKVEGIVHLPRGMLRWDIERGEVVKIVLDVGSFHDREPHVGEDCDELVGHLRDGMDGSGDLGTRWLGHIDHLRREAGIESVRFQFNAAGVDRREQFGLERIKLLAGRLAFVGVKSSQSFHQERDAALFA